MFRHYSYTIPKEDILTTFYSVHDSQIVEVVPSTNIPRSCDYSLSDLLSAGVKVAPVDPTIVHDSEATNSIAHDFVNNFTEPSNIDVEPSNNQ